MKPDTTNGQINDNLTQALRLFVVVLLAFVGVALLMVGLTKVFTDLGWVNLSDLGAQTQDPAGRNRLRAFVLVGNLLPFAGTAALALLFVFGHRWLAAAGLDRRPVPGSGAWSALVFVVALPFIGWLAYLNLQVPLPDWAVQSEESADDLLRGILTMQGPGEFLLGLLTLALTPALGEELLLRGVLQRRLLRPLFRGNAHLAIWGAAVIFSAMHVEFAGFAPRLVLGALLGYSYYWSRSLWVPIGLHFVFNGLQVVRAYVTGEYAAEADMAEVPAWYLGVLSLLAVGYLGYLAERRFGTGASLPSASA